MSIPLYSLVTCVHTIILHCHLCPYHYIPWSPVSIPLYFLVTCVHTIILPFFLHFHTIFPLQCSSTYHYVLCTISIHTTLIFPNLSDAYGGGVAGADCYPLILGKRHPGLGVHHQSYPCSIPSFLNVLILVDVDGHVQPCNNNWTLRSLKGTVYVYNTQCWLWRHAQWVGR